MPFSRSLRRLFAPLAVSLALHAAAATPEWLTGPPKKYPPAAYLIGRGAGSTAEEAQNRARGDLATVFEVRVEVVTESATTVNKSGGKEQVEKRDAQQVTASTDKVISGVSIAELWRDPATQDFHALAVLSRTQAAAGLREEIGAIDTSVQREVEAAAGQADPLLKLGALSRAFDTAVTRDGFQSSLKVVDSSGVGIPAPLPQAVLRDKIDQVVKQIGIAPEVAADSGVREFAGALKAGLAAAGFLARDAGRAEYRLLGKLELNDLGRQNNWHWVRGTVEIALLEKGSERVRGGRSWPIKASAQDAATARTRALQEVEKLLKQELRGTLIGFAAS